MSRKFVMWCAKCGRKQVNSTMVRNSERKVVFACNNCCALYWKIGKDAVQLTKEQDNKYRPMVF